MSDSFVNEKMRTLQQILKSLYMKRLPMRKFEFPLPSKKTFYFIFTEIEKKMTSRIGASGSEILLIYIIRRIFFLAIQYSILAPRGAYILGKRQCEQRSIINMLAGDLRRRLLKLLKMM